MERNLIEELQALSSGQADGDSVNWDLYALAADRIATLTAALAAARADSDRLKAAIELLSLHGIISASRARDLIGWNVYEQREAFRRWWAEAELMTESEVDAIEARAMAEAIITGSDAARRGRGES